MFSTSYRGGGFGPNDSSNLLVTPNIPVTPSFEDLASIASGTASVTSFLVDNSSSSGSSESIDKNFATPDLVDTCQLKGYPSPELWKQRKMDAKSKRSSYQSSRHSSSDLMLHNDLGNVDADQNGTSFATPRTADVKEKRKFLLRIHQVGESDPTLAFHANTEQGRKRSAVFPESASEGDLISKGGRELRPRHVNKATGIATL